ncbi:MAG: flavodoxin family protein [Vallitaleaceae bacterium]|jgi:multimeric flavodoxin WrbA|nr:flavodoxin family protein [Vallitaleaceae bacterium]
MRILGISGSPSGNGNTAYSVKYALGVVRDLGQEATYISLSDKKIGPCIGCFRCSGTGICWQADDMEGILESMRTCDGILIGSPVYMGMVSGQLKMMMDRSVALRAEDNSVYPLAGIIGGAIACGNSRNGGQETTIQNIQTFMMQQNMLVIGDGPMFGHSGGTIMGSAKSDEWGLTTVRNLATNMVSMIIGNKSSNTNQA